jgi:hypothetical protein
MIYLILSKYYSLLKKQLILIELKYFHLKKVYFIIVLVAIFPYIIQLSFIPIVILTVKAVVHEKETGIKEAMKLLVEKEEREKTKS